jgi:hypothetical protein
MDLQALKDSRVTAAQVTLTVERGDGRVGGMLPLLANTIQLNYGFSTDSELIIIHVNHETLLLIG